MGLAVDSALCSYWHPFCLGGLAVGKDAFLAEVCVHLAFCMWDQDGELLGPQIVHNTVQVAIWMQSSSHDTHPVPFL